MANTLQPNQIADAIIAAPGASLDGIIDTAPSGTAQTTSSSFASIDTNLSSVSFNVPFAGKYRFSLKGQCEAITSVSEARFRLNLDSGDQYTGDGNGQEISCPVGSREEFFLVFDQVELSAGSHAVTVEWRRVSGSGTIQTDAVAGWALSARSITGSGAGGVLNNTASLAATFTITNTTIDPSTSPNWQYIDNGGGDALSLTINTADEDIRITIVGATERIDDGWCTHWLGLEVDGAIVQWWQQGHDSTGTCQWSNDYIHTFSAGSHTIKVVGSRHTSDNNIYVFGADTGPSKTGFQLIAEQLYGGLVPVLKDGVLVQDKPRGVNYVGPNTTVTDIGGQVNVEFSGVADGESVQQRAMDQNHAITTNGAWVAVQDSAGDVALSVTATGNEWIEVSGKIQWYVSAASQIRFGLGVDGADPDVTLSMAERSEQGSGENETYAPYWRLQPGEGTHTLRLMAYLDSAITLTVRGGATPAATILWATIARGGYVQPENLPILEYSSASVVNVAAGPGAESTLRARLNDGMRYAVASPLTIDLTVSGRGGLDTGSEAVSTWYYCYLVPNAAGTALSALCSVTDPDSGGPTGFDVWRYIGAVRNDSSGNILKFLMSGGDITWYVGQTPSAASGWGSSFQDPKIEISIDDVVPLTAISANAFMTLAQNAVSTGSVLQLLYVEGESTDHVGIGINASGERIRTNAPSIPLPGSASKKIGYRSYDSGSGGSLITQNFVVLGFKDGHLSANREARAQAAPTQSNLWRYLDATNLPTGAAAPEAVWQFDGTASELDDRTANGHDLTLADGTVAHAAADGLIGLFSRNSFTLTAASPAGMRTTGSLTAVFLVAISEPTTTSYLLRCNAVGEAEADNELYSLAVLTSSLFRESHEYGAGSNEVLSFDAALLFGPLQHVAMTRSSDGLTHKIYVDGQLLDTQVAANAPTGGSAGAPTLLSFDSGGQFHGIMACALFTKEEWTAAQVLESYQFCRKLV